MLSDALRAAAHEAEELEKNQKIQEAILHGHGLELMSYGIEIKR
jgi:hypothetical protein